MKWYDCIIEIIVAYNIIVDFIMLFKSSNVGGQKTVSTKKHKNNLDIAINVVSSILFLSLHIFLVLSGFFPNQIFLVLIIIPGFIVYFHNILGISFSVIKKLSEKNDKSSLNQDDKFNIDIISGFFLLILRYYCSINKITIFITNQPLNKLQSESLLTLCYFVYILLIVLFVVIECMIPIMHLKILFNSIYKKTKCIWNIVDKHICQIKGDQYITAHYTNNVLSFSANLNSWCKYCSLIIFIPISILLDSIKGLFKFAYLYMFIQIIQFLIEIILLIEYLIINVLKLITKIPGNRIIINTFKLSGILSATSIIIAMRLSNLYQFDESFISVFEFIASAIIIPVIFEWIYSAQNDNKLNCKTSS